MASGVKITDTDKGAKKLLQRLLKKGALSVGILAEDASKVHEAKESVDRIKDIFKGFDSEGKSSGKAAPLTIGEIAEIHEFGLGSCPRRSFLAGWVDEKTPEIRDAVNKGAAALVAGQLESPLQFLNQLGAWAVGSIQQRMANNIPPPLSPQTIKRKGSSIALIDTGQLRSSIAYRVDVMKVLAAGGSQGAGPVTHGEDGGAAGGIGISFSDKPKGPKEWITGPRGGQYYIGPSGKKIYRSWELVKK